MSEPDNTSEKPKRTRKGAPKSRDGCLTCKIRHKRCDQTKPSCNRCRETGRKCDFSSPQPKSLLPSKPQQQLVCRQRTGNDDVIVVRNQLLTLQPKTFSASTREVNHFDYFRTVCAHELSGYFNESIWSTTILQVSYVEPSIRSAIIALAALLRCQSRSSRESQEYAIHYTTALNKLSQRLDDSVISYELAMIACLVFMAIETLRGGGDNSVKHLEGGFRIMRESMHKFPHLPGNLRELSSAFSRLDNQASTFGAFYHAKALRLPGLPNEFKSILEARDALDDVVAYMHFFVKPYGECYTTLPYKALPLSLSTELDTISSLLSQWSTTFESFLHTQNQTPKLDPRISILRIHHLAASIHLSTYFYADELSYDAFQSSFRRIVDLSNNITVTRSQSDSSPNTDSQKFSFDVAIVPPLYLVACKCRDPILRRRAIALLNRQGREGIWEGRAVAQVAKWVVEQEEGFVDRENEQNANTGLLWVPEIKRLRKLMMGVHKSKRIMRVVSTRRGADGVLEYLADDVAWSENELKDPKSKETKGEGEEVEDMLLRIAQWKEHINASS